MSSPARELKPEEMDLWTLKSELLRLPQTVREHLAYTLLDSLNENDEARADRRGIGEIDTEVEAAWAAEAHRRWQAYQRGEIKGVSEEEFFSELEARLHR